MLSRLYHLDHLYGLLADLRPRADHPGPVPQRLRRLRPALHHAPAAGGRAEPRLHVPAQLPRLGGRGLARRLLRHLVPDREDPARLLPARRHREPDAGRGLRHQRAAADHADLRLRRRASPPSPACWRRRSTRSTRNMGADLIIVVFAVVVIGGMGSIMGAILTGFGLGIIEGLTRVFYPEGSAVVIFVIMALVLLVKPAGPVREGRVMSDQTAPGVAMPGAAPDPRHAAAPHGHLRRAARVPAGRAVLPLPGLPDEGALLRALRLRLQPAARATAGCSPSAMPPSSGRRATSRRMRPRSGG